MTTMPPKPKLTRMLDGQRVANPAGTDPALLAINVQRRNFAVDAFHLDIEAKQPAYGRSGRVRDAIMEHFSCSKASAERTIREAKIYLSEQYDRSLPVKRYEMLEQLQNIADEQEREHPIAAVAALREKAKILGLYAPKKLEVTHGASPELALQLDAILAVLSDPERAALDVVLAGIERAKRDGQLALTEGEPDEDDVEDAELVEPVGEPTPGAPGAN